MHLLKKIYNNLTPLKIPIVISLITGVSIMLLMVPVVYITADSLRNHAQDKTKADADYFLHNKSDELTFKLDHAYHISQKLKLVFERDFTKIINNKDDDFIKDILNDDKDIIDAFIIYVPDRQKTSNALLNTNKPKHLSWRLDKLGQFIKESVPHFNKIQEIPLYNIVGQDLKNRTISFQAVYKSRTSVITSVIYPIIINNRFAGVIGVNIELMSNAKLQIKELFGDKASFKVYNEKKDLIWQSSNEDYTESIENSLLLPLSGVEPQKSYYLVNDASFTTSKMVQITNLNTTFFTSLVFPRKMIYRDANTKIILFIFLTIIVVLIAVITSFIVSYYKFQPASKLYHLCNKFNNGDESAIYNYNNFKGTSKLTLAFNMVFTSIKEKHQLLIENNLNQRSILDSLPDLLFELDKRGNIYDYHVPQGISLYVPASNWNGKPITELIPENVCDRIFSGIADAAINGIHRGTIYSLEIDGSMRWYELSAEKKSGHEGIDTRFIILVRDVTKWKQIEDELIFIKDNYESLNKKLNENNTKVIQINDELKSAKEKAKESEKLKLSFLANMSHEIRTPMNAIMGITELLVEDQILPNERTFYQRLVHSRAEDLLMIINDILDISRIESGALQISEAVCSIRVLMEEIRMYFESKKSKKCECKTEFFVVNEIDSNQDVIVTDYLRIKQVLINLTDNAFKYTCEGFIEVGCKNSDDDKVLFWVKDTGIGIDEDIRDKVFVRFRQATDPMSSRHYGGTGLGLSISKGIVEKLNGSIWFDTKVNKGSTFYFTIPFKAGKKTIIEKHLDN